LHAPGACAPRICARARVCVRRARVRKKQAAERSKQFACVHPFVMRARASALARVRCHNRRCTVFLSRARARARKRKAFANVFLDEHLIARAPKHVRLSSLLLLCCTGQCVRQGSLGTSGARPRTLANPLAIGITRASRPRRRPPRRPLRLRPRRLGLDRPVRPQRGDPPGAEERRRLCGGRGEALRARRPGPNRCGGGDRVWLCAAEFNGSGRNGSGRQRARGQGGGKGEGRGEGC
jgi:hypothetical protein